MTIDPQRSTENGLLLITNYQLFLAYSNQILLKSGYH